MKDQTIYLEPAFDATPKYWYSAWRKRMEVYSREAAANPCTSCLLQRECTEPCPTFDAYVEAK